MSNPTYGVRAARGAAWSILAILTSKAASFAAQLVLGWILTKEDFGLYALAVSIAWLAGIFADGGTRKILLQEGERYSELARSAFHLSLIFNCAAASALALAAQAISRFYDTPRLSALLWVVAGSMVLSTFGAVQRIRLAVDLRFRAAALLVAVSSILRQLSVVVFALLGCGALSFVLPLLVVALFEAIVGRVLAGPLPRGKPLDRAITKYLLGKSYWLILSALALAISFQGDYLVAGALQSQAVLGVYFFAFQLTYSLSTPLSMAIRSVLLPSFARLKQDVPRQAKAFTKSARVVIVVLATAMAFLVVMAPPLIHVLWGGRWDDAAIPVQVLGFGLPFILLAPLSMTLVEAAGHWRASALLTTLAAIGTVGAAALGASLGDATTLAVCISVNQVLVGMVQAAIAARLLDVPRLTFGISLARPVALAAGCAGLTLWLASVTSLGATTRLLVSPIVLSMLLFMAGRLFVWEAVKECVAFIAAARRGNQQADA